MEGTQQPREQALIEAATPVRADRKERSAARPREGVALCLSGGGYRAMLFHLGALWRLNELGFLPKLDTVSSVSGGSITAGVLAHGWARLELGADGVARGFRSEVAAPIHELAGRTLDVPAIAKGVLLPGSVASRLAAAYDRHLFRGASLQELPDRPRFVINATNLQSGVLWRFSKSSMRDYRVGQVPSPLHALALAVAASSAFPPFLSPLTLKLDPSLYGEVAGEDLARPPFTTRPVLSDGGVYDNLGLEVAWKRHATVLVSDGGGLSAARPRVRTYWPLQAFRVLNVIDGQVRALRKRQVIGGLAAGLRDGAYWSIWSEIEDFDLPDALECADGATKALARVSTRLARLEPGLQRRLVNWGYAICDTAMRRHVLPGTRRPDALPYPEDGI